MKLAEKLNELNHFNLLNNILNKLLVIETQDKMLDCYFFMKC